MRDDDRRAFPLVEIAFEPLHGGDVEVVGRLVEQQQVGIGEQQAGEKGAGALSTRKMVQASGVIPRRKSEAGQHLLDARVVGVAAPALEVVLQRAVAGEGFVGMAGIGHQRFEPV